MDDVAASRYCRPLTHPVFRQWHLRLVILTKPLLWFILFVSISHKLQTAQTSQESPWTTWELPAAGWYCHSLIQFSISDTLVLKLETAAWNWPSREIYFSDLWTVIIRWQWLRWWLVIEWQWLWIERGTEGNSWWNVRLYTLGPPTFSAMLFQHFLQYFFNIFCNTFSTFFAITLTFWSSKKT